MRSTYGSRPRAPRIFAWAGAVLFFASLAYFLYAYVVTWNETAPPGASTARAVAIDVALFTAFALHHSVFARERVRAAVARAIPPHLERASYVWIASLMLAIVCALWQPVPGRLWHATGPGRWALLAGQAAGVLLVLRSAAALDIFELSGIRQLDGPLDPAAFTTRGPYGWVRHPIYSGWFLLVLCVPTMTLTRLVFAAVSCAYLVAAIPLEERSLRAASSGGYDAYARRVRWRLVPGVY